MSYKEQPQYVVYYRDLETGSTTEKFEYLDWHEGSLFWHTEGNMGCDCNRSIDVDLPCNTGKNRIVIDKIKLLVDSDWESDIDFPEEKNTLHKAGEEITDFATLNPNNV